MKTILIISYYFPPAGGGGVQRILKLLKYADHSKFRFKLICAVNPGISVNDSKLTGDIPENVEIHRVVSKPPHEKFQRNQTKIYETSFFIRLISSFIFIPDSRVSWTNQVLNYLQEKSELLEDVKLILATMPPFSSGVLAYKIKQKYGIPYILDYRDGWKYNPFQIYPTFIHSAIQRKMESRILTQSQGVVFVNRSLQNTCLEKFSSIPWQKIKSRVIYNGFDEEDYSHLQKVEKLPSLDLNIGLPGTIYFREPAPSPFFVI